MGFRAWGSGLRAWGSGLRRCALPSAFEPAASPPGAPACPYGARPARGRAPPLMRTHTRTIHAHSLAPPPAPGQVVEVLADHLAQWSCSVAFPELAHVPLLHLKKFSKACPVERFK